MKQYTLLIFTYILIAGWFAGCTPGQDSRKESVSDLSGNKKELETPKDKLSDIPSQQQFNPSNQKETSEKQYKILISTPLGNMTAILYNETPVHRDNFVKLVKEGFYDGTLFHRVIKDFMIQGGDPISKNAAPAQPLGTGGPGYTLPAEFHPALIHKKGAIAAARTSDNVNPERRSSGSQFYIVQGKKITPSELNVMAIRNGITYTPEQIKIYETIGGTPFLDQQYTVFGEVIEGLEVIDAIASVPTEGQNRPLKDIKMTIRLIND